MIDGLAATEPAGSLRSVGRSTRASGSAAGSAPRCAGSSFCRKRRKSTAREKTRGAARIGSRPLASTSSKRHASCRAAAACMRGTMNAGKSSPTTTQASCANAASRPLPAPGDPPAAGRSHLAVAPDL